MKSKGQNIISKVVCGFRLTTPRIYLSSPYIKFGLLGFTQWGDLNNDKVNEWRFLGWRLYNNKEGTK